MLSPGAGVCMHAKFKAGQSWQDPCTVLLFVSLRLFHLHPTLQEETQKFQNFEVSKQVECWERRFIQTGHVCYTSTIHEYFPLYWNVCARG